ncbi:MAG: hypothetical protein ACE5DL_04795 [Nitrosopumilaceae archaeon]
MSEILNEHPIVFIDKLLKLGIGDKGRLLYLRNYIKSGKTIYDSDKTFLKIMEQKLDETQFSNQDSSETFSSSTMNNSIKFSKNDNDILTSTPNYSVDEDDSSSSFDSGILKIQNSIGELQKSNSKLRDNLELITLSRKNLPSPKIEKFKLFSSPSNIIKNETSNSVSSLKTNSNLNSLKLFGMKKYDVLAYSSAGLFTLWYASFQNIIELGIFENISLGLSIGSAVTAGILYKKHKTS